MKTNDLGIPSDDAFERYLVAVGDGRAMAEEVIFEYRELQDRATKMFLEDDPARIAEHAKFVEANATRILLAWRGLLALVRRFAERESLRPPFAVAETGVHAVGPGLARAAAR